MTAPVAVASGVVEPKKHPASVLESARQIPAARIRRFTMTLGVLWAGGRWSGCGLVIGIVARLLLLFATLHQACSRVVGGERPAGSRDPARNVLLSPAAWRRHVWKACQQNRLRVCRQSWNMRGFQSHSERSCDCGKSVHNGTNPYFSDIVVFTRNRNRLGLVPGYARENCWRIGHHLVKWGSDEHQR
jgi:hypothetical protein